MASVVKVDPDTNLEKAAVIGCSVPTGFWQRHEHRRRSPG